MAAEFLTPGMPIRVIGKRNGFSYTGLVSHHAIEVRVTGPNGKSGVLSIDTHWSAADLPTIEKSAREWVERQIDQGLA